MPTPLNQPHKTPEDLKRETDSPQPVVSSPREDVPVPGRHARERDQTVAAPRPADAPDTDRFGRGEVRTGDEDAAFTAPDSDQDPPSDPPDTDESKDTDDGTDGTPVLA